MHIRQTLKYAIIALVGSGALSVASAQTSSATLKAIKERGAISVGHRESLIPFSYYDQDQKVVGYSADICLEILPAIAKAAGVDNLKIAPVPVSSSNRIPLLANWTIDMECGATTNNTERQRHVSFSVTHFVTSNRFVAKKSQNLARFDDLKGKTVVSVSGTTNIKQLTELNAARNLGINILAVKDHAEAFLAVETDRAMAFVMDDVILAGFVSGSKDPSAYQISQEPLSLEPYGFMMRRDDPEFKTVVDKAIADLFKSPKMKEIYAKWFLRPIPPRGNTLAMPISDALSKVLAAPTDSADPAAYR
ncbi:glutamate/aspartate transport system substrate-binding protein [Bradyrhizobium sp. AZCC 1577]|uniref:amino acid ABC transporter substrate-binding protein n=1 Tax=Bradyrhizobium sp. AZCC 1577 TaxID=3117019 RepID=UPI002FF27237